MAKKPQYVFEDYEEDDQEVDPGAKGQKRLGNLPDNRQNSPHNDLTSFLLFKNPGRTVAYETPSPPSLSPRVVALGTINVGSRGRRTRLGRYRGGLEEKATVTAGGLIRGRDETRDKREMVSLVSGYYSGRCPHQLGTDDCCWQLLPPTIPHPKPSRSASAPRTIISHPQLRAQEGTTGDDSRLGQGVARVWVDEG